MSKKAIENLSTEELEQMLTQRKATEREEQQRKRNSYEKDKEKLINQLGLQAADLSSVLTAFKKTAMSEVVEFRKVLLEYGDLKGGEKNKGNFEIKNDRYKINFSSQIKKCFDERSELAEEKLKKFLSSTVKKRDKDLHDLILSLLERNSKTGDLDISNIQRLYKMEDRFNENEDWKAAIQLFKESYNPEGTAYYVRFFKKNETNGWDLINLNFSSI